MEEIMMLWIGAIIVILAFVAVIKQREGVYKNFCGYSEIITKKGVPHETRTGSV